MNTSSNGSAWCLRFASGPMRGRTLALAAGMNVLGSAGGCDLMLPGPDVRPRHLQLHVGELALALHRIGDAPVKLNGADMTAARRSLVVGDRLALGAIELEVDRVYANDGPDDGEADPMFLPEAAAASHASAPDRGTGDRRWVRALPAFAVAFAVSTMLLGWLLATAPGGQAGNTVGPDVGALRQVLAGYPELELLALEDGRMEVTGFVESQLRRGVLEAALRPFGAQVALKVQTVDSLVERARAFIGDAGVAVSYGGKGRLVLSGATESTASQAKIARLAEDMHPAVLVTDKVLYKPKAAADNDASSLWTNWQSLLPARVVSISQDADGLRHIQLANGNRYYEGALLKSGAQLKIVRPDELVITPEAAP